MGFSRLHGRAVLAGLAAFSGGLPLSVHAVTSSVLAAPASDAVSPGVPESDGWLPVTLTFPRAAGLFGKVVVTGDDGTVRETETGSSPANNRITFRVRTRSKDTVLKFSAPPVAGTGAEFVATMPVPPMFFARDTGGAEPGLDAVFTVPVYFTQRLDPVQKPPRVSAEPAVPGLVASIEGDALVLSGAFPTRTPVAVKLGSDLLSADGRVFKAGEKIIVNVRGRPGTAEFLFESGVLSPAGSLGVPFRICNLPRVTVREAFLDPSNLVAALHSDPVRDRLVEGGEPREVPLRTAPDEVREFLFDLKPKAGEGPRRGLRLLRLEWKDGEYDWHRSAEAFVCVTDIALTPVLDADGRHMTVWTTGLSTGASLAGVEVAVRNAQNRVIASGVSDTRGLVRLEVPGKPGESPAWIVTGSLGDDFSYVRTDAATAPENTRGLPSPATGLDVMLYGERGVWRGGETVRLAGIVRTADGAPPPPVPLEVRLRRFDGRVFARGEVVPGNGPGGFFNIDFPLGPDVPYGRYTAEVRLPGATSTLTTLEVPVAAFEPLRLRTTLTVKEKPEAAGPARGLVFRRSASPPVFFLDSQYRFGGPAAGLASSANFRIEPDSFASAAYPGFTFGYRNEGEGRIVRAARGVLDPAGARELTFPTEVSPGVWSVSCHASVTEPGGRTDTAFSRLVWITAPIVPGLALPEEGSPRAGQKIPVRVALLTSENVPAKSAVAVTLTAERLIENWTLQREKDTRVWRRTEERVPAGEWRLEAGAFHDGAAVGDVLLDTPGAYRLTVKTDDGVRSELPLYVSGIGQPVAGVAPHRIQLKPSRASAAPGDTVTVTVEAPFTGPALLTLETDRVLESRVVELRERNSEIPVTMPAGVRGSVWVGLRAIRPLDAKQPVWKPVVARGFAMIAAEAGTGRLDCTVVAPAKALPGASAELVVKVAGAGGKPVAVHCWAVDTGVLDITAFKTPDPFLRFLGPKRDAVLSTTTLDGLLPDFARTLERIGAGEVSGAYRGSGLRHRKPVAVVWSEPGMTGADGVLRRTITLPEHTGSLRWMVVAAQDDRYGSGSAETVLARPVQIEASAPAFAADGDRFFAPVAFFNNGSKDIRAAVTVAVRGELGVESGLPETVLLPAGGKPWRGRIGLRAKAATGDADIRVTLSGDFEGGATRESVPVNLRPAAPFESASRVFELKPGESRHLEKDTPGFVPGTAHLAVRAGDGLLAGLAPGFAALLDYPHGCVEQTSSRMIAVAAAADAFDVTDSGAAASAKSCAEGLLRMGVLRLTLLRRGDGGFGYWPDSPRSDAGGTLLAAEALIASAARGVKADDALLADLRSHLRRRLYEASTEKPAQARLCAALAGLGEVETNRLRYLTENCAELNAGDLASLALAWHRAGDPARGRALLEENAGRLSPASVLQRTDRYAGSLEQDARVLEALAALSPESPRAGAYASNLVRLAGGESLNTLESGAVVAAVAHYTKARPDLVAGKSDVRLSGAGVASESPAGRFWRDLADGTARTLENKGAGTAFVSVNITGVPLESSDRVVDAGLSVRRELLDPLSGEPLEDGEPLRVGQSVLVRLSLTPTDSDGREIPDVAVVDLFPACFEPDGSKIEFKVNGAVPGYWDSPFVRSEIREDRALFFVTARRNMTMQYLVRVVAAGTFAQAAPQAESMYRPEIRSKGTASKIESRE